jgi:hypothetical protein
LRSKKSKELTIPLDDDLDRYLNFLEKIKLVRHKEDAVLAAIRIFKKLNMHDWLPYIYRSGTERVLIMSHGMLNDIFTSVTEGKLYEIARVSALKRTMIDPLDPNLILTELENWDIVLIELENMGWGKFTRIEEEIMVEYSGIPIMFLKGYLETLFQVEFRIHQTKKGDVYVLSKERMKKQIWL